jgi:amino acid transporter
MTDEEKPSIPERVKRRAIGKALNPFDPRIFHKISLVAFFAWIGLGADALSSSSYGPAEAFITLGSHPFLAVFVALATVFTILIISTSYSQIVELFPNGGGGYLVASKLLSPRLGMLSGCALLIDYVLTITLSVASGAEAVFSFVPHEWRFLQIWFAVAGVLVLILMNLRGVKESVKVLMPIFLLFVVTHVFILLYAFAAHVMNFPSVAAGVVSDVNGAGAELGLFGLLLLIMRSYSMGAGTYTGIEAVSNGIPILMEPKVQTAKRTMKYMAFSLIFMVIGLMLAYLLFDVVPHEGKTLNAVLFENVTQGWGPYGYYFVVIALVSEAALLFVAAQTGFVDGPRVLANMALDRWFPTRFANLSDRLVTYNGILIMGVSSLVLMILSGGSVQALIALYSITVFLTFFLSQAGMVRYWWKSRSIVKNWDRRFLINGTGLALTFFILVSMVFMKFNEGGWMTIVITAALVLFVSSVRKHYDHTAQLVAKLNKSIHVAGSGQEAITGVVRNCGDGKFDPCAKTAILLVSGFNGVGVSTLSSVFRSFGGVFNNFIFVEVGVIDAGVFKGELEVQTLRKKVRSEVDHYVDFMRQMGYYAEGVELVGLDVVDEIAKAMPDILGRFPNSVLFGGQIILPKSQFLSDWLHNYTLFALQSKLYYTGAPFVMVPIKVE